MAFLNKYRLTKYTMVCPLMVDGWCNFLTNEVCLNVGKIDSFSPYFGADFGGQVIRYCHHLSWKGFLNQQQIWRSKLTNGDEIFIIIDSQKTALVNLRKTDSEGRWGSGECWYFDTEVIWHAWHYSQPGDGGGRGSRTEWFTRMSLKLISWSGRSET